MEKLRKFDVTVTYTLTDEREVEIDYRAETDQATILQSRNHSYFNASGRRSDDRRSFTAVDG